MESRSFWVCSRGPTSISRFIAWMARPFDVFASLSWALQVSGTVRLNAIMALSAAIFLTNASSRVPAQSRRLCLQDIDELIPFLRQEFDAVGGEQLVVAKRGGNCLRAGPRGFQPRLHVVFAVAAGLERIDANGLLLRDAGGRGDPGIGAFVLDLALRLLRSKPEFPRRCFQQVGDHRYIFSGRRLLDRRGGIDRSRWSRINRWLAQHVVLEQGALIVA